MPKKDVESGKYSKVDQDEEVKGSSIKRMSFGFSKKPTRETVADHDETSKSKQKVAPPPEELEGAAFDSIAKAQWIVKIMAIMQNPSRITEIINAENLSEGLEDHYGTDDPVEVSKIILHDLQDAIRNGTWSVGRLAFFGGAYACVVGLLQLMPPMGIFAALTPLAALNTIFLFIFGLITMTVESSGDTISASLKAGIMKYCAALDEIWGRGFFYTYMGITQILAPSERKFGWYMFLVGLLYLGIYHQTSKHIDELAGLFNDTAELEKAYKEHAGVDGVLNRDELARLFFDLEIDMSHAEMEMMMKRLDPDHDGYITLTELKDALAHHTKNNSAYYTIGPVPKMDPSKGDTLSISHSKKKAQVGGIFGLGGGGGGMDWNKVKVSV